MRKIITALLLTLFTTYAHAGVLSGDAFIVSNDVTISHLENFRLGVINKINSFPGGNIQSGTVAVTALDANATPVNRWKESFNDYVYTGLLPPTSASLVSITTAGTAYISGYRVVKDATSHTYTASKDTYIYLSKNGVYTYSEKDSGVAPDPTPADNIILAKVVTSTTAVTSVTDLRVTGISFGGGNDDAYIKGMELITISPDVLTVTVDAGVCYNGSTRVGKVAKTTLKFNSASDWWDGTLTGHDYTGTVSTDCWAYVGVKTDGSIKFLTSTAPNYADTSGNTAGKLKYWKDTSNKYWRVIGAFPVGNGTYGTANRLRIHFKQRNDWVYYPYTTQYPSGNCDNSKVRIVTLGQTTANQWKDANVSFCVPAFSNMINIDWYAGASAYVNFAVDNNNAGRGQTSAGGTYRNNIYDILITSGHFQWGEEGNHDVTMFCSGYYMGDLR